MYVNQAWKFADSVQAFGPGFVTFQSPCMRQHHLSNVLQKLLQLYMRRLHYLLFCLRLVAGLGVPHSQECGTTPDHCQEAQLESLGPQQEAGLEGMARRQEAHQCIPLLTSGLPQCLERAKRKNLMCLCFLASKDGYMGLPCGLLLDGRWERSLMPFLSPKCAVPESFLSKNQI